MTALTLTEDQTLDALDLTIGYFHPLNAFMGESEIISVAENFKMPDGTFFPMPVFLDLGECPHICGSIHQGPVDLVADGQIMGAMWIDDIFSIDRLYLAEAMYGTGDPRHPSVSRFTNRTGTLVSGSVELDQNFITATMGDCAFPDNVITQIGEMGWRTAVGFASRNVPHRGHEYLLARFIQEFDGVVIQPTICSPEPGKYRKEAIKKAFEYLLNVQFEANRYILAMVRARSFAAGPREAVLQAVIRRNCGCTHFIIGRDHSGVGDFYGRYEAQQLGLRLESELGIKIVAAREPYYCAICRGIVTDEICSHEKDNPEAVRYISSTDVRAQHSNRVSVENEIVNQDVVRHLGSMRLLYEST